MAIVFVKTRDFLLGLGPKLFPPTPAPLAPPTPSVDAVTQAYVDESDDERRRRIILNFGEVLPTGFVMIRAPRS